MDIIPFANTAQIILPPSTQSDFEGTEALIIANASAICAAILPMETVAATVLLNCFTRRPLFSRCTRWLIYHDLPGLTENAEFSCSLGGVIKSAKFTTP